MAKKIRKMATLALACCGYTVIGCSGGEGANQPAQESQDSAGSIGLALQLASGATINSATYTIIKPMPSSRKKYAPRRPANQFFILFRAECKVDDRAAIIHARCRHSRISKHFCLLIDEFRLQ